MHVACGPTMGGAQDDPALGCAQASSPIQHFNWAAYPQWLRCIAYRQLWKWAEILKALWIYGHAKEYQIRRTLDNALPRAVTLAFPHGLSFA